MSLNNKFKKIFKKSVGQGTVEYLVLLAVIVIIALVAVFIILNINNSDSLESNSQKLSKTVSDFSIVDEFYLNDGNYILSFKSNLSGQIKINKITVGEFTKNFYQNNVISLNLDRTFIVNSSDTCKVNEKIDKQVIIEFTDARGFNKTLNENFSFNCSSEITPNLDKLASSEVLVTCASLISSNDLNSDQCNDSNHACYNHVFCIDLREE
jgi:hypothetical protein